MWADVERAFDCALEYCSKQGEFDTSLIIRVLLSQPGMTNKEHAFLHPILVLDEMPSPLELLMGAKMQERGRKDCAHRNHEHGMDALE